MSGFLRAMKGDYSTEQKLKATRSTPKTPDIESSPFKTMATLRIEIQDVQGTASISIGVCIEAVASFRNESEYSGKG